MTDEPQQAPGRPAMSGAQFSRDTRVPIPYGATVSLRIPRRGPLPLEKALIVETMGTPTRRVRDGRDNVILHWDYLR